jgi:SAM-dependent methyltransferase
VTDRTSDPTSQEISSRPLRLGSADDFAGVELLLKSAGFDEPTILRTLKLEEMADLSSIKPDENDLASSATGLLALLIRLFLFSECVRRTEVERLIGSATLGSFQQLDILRAGTFDLNHRDSAQVYYSPVFLYPIAGLLIASDRHNNPDGSEFLPPPDIVFPAINGGTLLFLKIISKSPAENILDLCSGTGVAALLLSQHVQQASTSDITARATHFAKFNRLLNRCYNVEVVQGDLYDAVEGQTFDRIVAHPPYVPSLSQKTIYRDGGETGEILVRRIIEGLPRFLRPGGTYYSLSVGLDTEEGNFEERARQWLGSCQDEFDVIFAFGDERSPRQFARERAVLSGSADASEIVRWDEIFGNVGAHSLVYGAMVIHRREKDSGAAGLPPLTIRPRLSTEVDGADFERALQFHQWRRRPDAVQELAGAKPRLAQQLKVKVTHVVSDGALVPSEYVLESPKPFPVATKVDTWIVRLIAELDGEKLSSELYQAARDRSMLPDWFMLSDFLDLLATLIERGYVEVHGSSLKNDQA